MSHRLAKSVIEQVPPTCSSQRFRPDLLAESRAAEKLSSSVRRRINDPPIPSAAYRD